MDRIITISLIITAIHVCTLEGMIFHKPASRLGEWLTAHHIGVLAKPIYQCLICMGGIWTLVLYPLLYGWSLDVLVAVPCVIGANSIVSHFINHMYE